MEKIRKIIHIDMDAFFASVEQRDNPELRGKPIIVGGSPNTRSVVATCSYEARKYGIHSAMASSVAYKLCPHAIFVPHRFEAYVEASNQIRELFYEYTDLVEPLSLDEAYLDVTENKKNNPSATLLAKEILAEIYKRTNLTASGGVSYNKFLAKVASDFNKPNGLTVVTPELAAPFIAALPIRKFHGIGKVTEKKMKKFKIYTGADLKKFSLKDLTRLFGRAGEYYYGIAHGIDNRPVSSYRERKSIGKETTLQEDIDDKNKMLIILEKIAVKLEESMKRKSIRGVTVTLKVKYEDFISITRAATARTPIIDAEIIMNYVKILLEKTEAGERKVRLLGIAISNFVKEDETRPKWEQLYFPF